MTNNRRTGPGWFERAIADAPDQITVDVDGCAVAALVWGHPGRPGLVFVHGGGAHAHWWSFIAPLFADTYRVAALDLSGHGDSGRRSDYSLDHWTEEVVTVAEHADMDGSPIVIGHSMGGFVTVATAARHADRVAGIVILDSPITENDPESGPGTRDAFQKRRIYPDRATAISRFRTIPEQDHYEPYIFDWVAEHSVTEVEDGWTWKFDPVGFLPRRSTASVILADVSCRVALFRAEHGLVTPDIGAFMYERLGRIAPVVEIPEAGHHLMLDQPLLVVTALRTLLADWQHSTPERRS